MTTYAKKTLAIAPDEERLLSLDDASRLPGLLGRIARAMLEIHGVYGYTDARTGKKILLRLV